MTTHKNNDREYLFLEVPEGAHSFKFRNGQELKTIYFKVGDDFNGLTNVKTQGAPKKTIGIASELTEEQAVNLVEVYKGQSFQNYNYLSKCFMPLFTAVESLKSLITSLGLNPERTLIIERKK
jgi:hypothetical protein